MLLKQLFILMRENPIYKEYLTVSAETGKLFSIYNDRNLTEQERNARLVEKISELYNRYLALIILVKNNERG